MRDDEGGAPLHHRLQRRLHIALGLRIQGGGGLVQYQYGRVLQEGTGDGEALALAAGQEHAVIAHQRLVAVRQLVDELGGIGALRRLRYGALARPLQRPIADVARHSVVEQGHLLADDGDVRAQVLQGEVLGWTAVYEDLPADRRVEPGQEANQGALAAAGAPHQRHRLPGRHLEAQVLQHQGPVALVAEAQIAELHLPLHPLQRRLACVLFHLLVKQAEDVPGGGQAPLDGGVDLRQLAHRLCHEAAGGDEDDHIAGAHVAKQRRVEHQPHQKRQRQRHH